MKDKIFKWGVKALGWITGKGPEMKTTVKESQDFINVIKQARSEESPGGKKIIISEMMEVNKEGFEAIDSILKLFE